MKTKKRIIFGSVCMILLLSLVGGTLAWFYVNEEVTVGYGNSIFCEAGDSLEISLVEDGTPGRWGSTIDYSAGNFTVVDITGDGTKLFKPTEIDENQQPVGFVDAVSSLEDSKNYNYVEMEVAFRAVSPMNVYLSEESFIDPVNTGYDPDEMPNIYGDFSRDYIAGAMRVAVIDDSGLKMLWAPNSKYELIQSDRGTYSFKANGTAESSYSYYVSDISGEDEETTHILRKVSNDLYASKTFVVDSTGAKKNYTGNSPVLVSLNPASEGAYDLKTVKIRIWFEGTDREAHQALAGGNVNVKLKFVGISKETDEDKQNAIKQITYNDSTFSGLAQGMVYSIDGRTWKEYTNVAALPTLESGASIYIKYPETDTHFETDYIKFTKD